jgi:hypothetical protein
MIKRIRRLAAFGAAIFALSPACSQSLDTSQWRVESNPKWGFVVSVPPLWLTMDWPTTDDQLIIRREFPGGVALRCQGSSRLEPTTATQDQGRLNAYTIQKGPGSSQVLAAIGNARNDGDRRTGHSSSLVVVNGYPAYFYDISDVLTSTSSPMFGHTLVETIFVVGRNFSLSCSADGYNLELVNKTYVENLPTLHAVMASLVILPSR